MGSRLLINPPSLPLSLPPFLILSDKTTMNDMLDVASSNIKTLGGFLQAEPVGAYERADKGMEALPVPVSVVKRGGGREGGRAG